jgi:rhamnopyranosyl-N-acetylglucosaminyl-diphospho-decaprenol beta-1,3/1,4-galactofuranosyltransferase
VQAQPRIAATVITFNRAASLERCIRHLQAQSRAPDAIWVIDNASTDGTAELAASLHAADPRVQYLNTGGNLGSGGGQRAACEVGLRSGADAVWTMDDDCYSERVALQSVLDVWLKLPGRELTALNSNVFEYDGDRLSFGLSRVLADGEYGPTAWHMAEVPPEEVVDGLYWDYANLFNGTFLPRGVIERVGLPRAELFIWGDEVEYFHRIRRGARIATVVQSIVRHPGFYEDQPVAAWKKYYLRRNQIIIQREYFSPNKLLFDVRTARWLLSLIRRFPRQHGLDDRLTLVAVKDALLRKYDRDARREFGSALVPLASV